MKSGNLNFLEPSGPLQACNGTDLPFATCFGYGNHHQADISVHGHDMFSGPDSVVSIATGYGLDGPGIESRWGLDFPHLSGPALGPTQPPVQGVPGLSRR